MGFRGTVSKSKEVLGWTPPIGGPCDLEKVKVGLGVDLTQWWSVAQSVSRGKRWGGPHPAVGSDSFSITDERWGSAILSLLIGNLMLRAERDENCGNDDLRLVL